MSAEKQGGELHDAELHAREALDRIDDGFVVYDRDWRILYMNHAAETYFGQPRGEMLGRVVWELFPSASGTEFEQVLRRAAASVEPSELEMLAPARRRWVAFRVFPGEQGVSISFRDITDKKRSADALRASEARYRALFEHSLDGILDTAPTGEILGANPAACRMLERTEEELCAVGRAGVIDVSDPRLPAILEERRRTGHARAELRVLRKDGATFPAEISSAIFVDAEGRERTSMTLRDLSAQKRAEERLKIIADAGAVLGRALDSRQTLADLVGLVLPRLADGCALDLLEGGELRRAETSGAELPADVAEAIARVARGGDAELLTAPPRSAIVVPIAAPSRAILGVLSLVRAGEHRLYEADDLVTARALGGRAALAIDNARLHEQTTAAKRLRDEVLGIVSHDLRNPISAVLVAARLLARKINAPELASIERSVRYADSLIGSLLTVAALEGGSLPLKRARESIAVIVDEAIAMHRELAVERSIALEAAAPPELPAVSVDRNRILQVLANLIGNALKFTQEGGRVRVEAQLGAGVVVISVSDTGPGIVTADLPHVFDRFWQGAHAQRAGAGLGLAICKGIVEAHGGTVGVESVLGQGATFRVSLPIAT